MRVTLFFLAACLLPCVLVAFRAGVWYKEQQNEGATTTSVHSRVAGKSDTKSNDDKDEKLGLWSKAEKQRRYVVVCSDDANNDSQGTAAGGQCSQEESAVTSNRPSKIVLETITFGEDGFSQYDDDDDDDEEEDDDDDDDDDDDNESNPYGIIISVDAIRVHKSLLQDLAAIRTIVMDLLWMVSDDVDVAMQSMICQQKEDTSRSIFCSATLSDGNHLQLGTHPDNHSLFLNLRLIDEQDQTRIIFYLEQRLDVRQEEELPVICRSDHANRGFRDRQKRWRVDEQDIADFFTGNPFDFLFPTKVRRCSGWKTQFGMLTWSNGVLE